MVEQYQVSGVIHVRMPGKPIYICYGKANDRNSVPKSLGNRSSGFFDIDSDLYMGQGVVMSVIIYLYYCTDGLHN